MTTDAAAEDRLRRAIAGDPQTAPILRIVWAAIRIRLELTAPGGWVNRTDAEDYAADIADAAPRLATELVAVAIGAGLLDLRRYANRQQIRPAAPAAGTDERKPA